MRSLVMLACLAFALGCSSVPLETAGAGADDETGSDPAGGSGGARAQGGSGPSGGSDTPAGDFRPLGVYPPGPYGSALGAIIQDHTFYGWRDPRAAGYDIERLERVSLSDFHDPRGEAIELLVVNASAVWCPVCRFEMDVIDSRGLAAAYRDSKVMLFGTLFEDNAGRPARPSDLALWGSGLGFTVDFPLVLDPGLQLGPYFADSATPLNLVIDARTMEILEAYMGYGEALWNYVDELLVDRGVTPPER